MAVKAPRFVIYCHTNTVTGKRYVGQSKQGLMSRWQGHVTAAFVTKVERGCRVLNAAIRKYGASAFTHEVLEEVIGQDAANEAEVRWIASLNTRAPNGYNLDAGGGALADKHEATRRIISERMTAQMAALSPEQRRAMATHAAMSGTPEERSERAKRGKKSMSAERRRAASKAGGVAVAAKRPEHFSEMSRRGHEGRSPEQYAAISAKRLASEPGEKRKERLTRATAAAMALPPEKKAASRKKAVATLLARAAARSKQTSFPL